MFSALGPIQNHLGNRWTFIIAAIVGVCGVLVTFFFVPNISGDDLAVADERFRLYLVEKGWEGTMGEEDLKALADQGISEEVVEDFRRESDGNADKKKE